MNWYRKWLLKQHKKRALVEVIADINFIVNHRSDWLNYDESAGRKVLREQNDLGEKADRALVDSTSRRIAEHLSTKKELQELREMHGDMKKYIDML